ncbi:MAG: ArsR/SmtB family transcription factor [Saccharofermentanales bacterium]|jgi:DNA-binding transcriptional ArsR family regulator
MATETDKVACEPGEENTCQMTEEMLAEVKENLPPSELLLDLADLYKMFGDSTRLSILSALRQGELCVMHLAEILNMTQSAISHQLRALRANNLVRYRREGKLSYYCLADEHVETIIDMGLEHILEERVY